MDDNIKQVEDLLTKLRSQMKEAVEEAYNRGWDDGVAATPDHKAFHERHHQPAQYIGLSTALERNGDRVQADAPTEESYTYLLT